MEQRQVDQVTVVRREVRERRNAGGVQNGIYFGAFNGTWWALFTSFAWPWIMPERVDRWMYDRTD